jgi:hypothetical protein
MSPDGDPEYSLHKGQDTAPMPAVKQRAAFVVRSGERFGVHPSADEGAGT